jgi:membrane fusion protein (multidrug efflux system)
MRANFSVSQQLMIQMMARAVAEGKTNPRSDENFKGPELELILATGSVYPLKGYVRFADNQVDVRTGTIRVVGEFPNPERLLVAGMFTRVRALLDVQKNALVVPQRSVTEMQGRSLVAVVAEDNKISIRPVTTGASMGSDWVITGEVKAGDRVVAEGIQKVRDGVTVNPVPFRVAAATASEASPAEKQ